LHQVFSADWAGLRALPSEQRAWIGADAASLFTEIAEGADGGWSAGFKLVGGGGDWLFVHFRPTLDELAEVQRRVSDSALGVHLRREYDYLSVTEAGLYHATAQAAQEAKPGSDEYRRMIQEAIDAEGASDHLPVVVAAARAVMDPVFDLTEVQVMDGVHHPSDTGQLHTAGVLRFTPAP
ncbi:MAG: chlorite dismutase family protein, partial [Proteobacteria bacterium]|nr:chlorite dismutase family protein [Pseudomonadota bacterium]